MAASEHCAAHLHEVSDCVIAIADELRKLVDDRLIVMGVGVESELYFLQI